MPRVRSGVPWVLESGSSVVIFDSLLLLITKRVAIGLEAIASRFSSAEPKRRSPGKLCPRSKRSQPTLLPRSTRRVLGISENRWGTLITNTLIIE